MNKKHKNVVKKLRKQLDRMRVAFALADDHVEELQTLHDEDDMAIEHPRLQPMKNKKLKRPKKSKLPKPAKNYTRG